MAALVGLATLARIGWSLVPIIGGVIEREPRRMLIGGAALIGLFAALQISGIVALAQESRAKARGDRIAAALVAYHAAKGG